jgi:hypothetical protein
MLSNECQILIPRKWPVATDADGDCLLEEDDTSAMDQVRIAIEQKRARYLISTKN